jgi:hypothetical protein
MRISKLATAALISLALVGCVAGWAASPSTSPAQGAIGLGVVNQTDLQVSLVVNGALIKTFGPQTGDKAIYMSALPPLPWLVEARTSSGRVLVTMTVSSGDMPEPTHVGSGGIMRSGKLASVGLSCGELRIWTGDYQPSEPAPEAGSPGDCLP